MRTAGARIGFMVLNRPKETIIRVKRIRGASGSACKRAEYDGELYLFAM